MTWSIPRRSILAAVLVGALASAFAAGAQTGNAGIAFVSGIEDLPLMPGLGEIEGTDMIFDTPGGRIVEVSASGPVGRAQVVEFYAATLPHLGWSPAGATRFSREGETLELHFSDTPTGTRQLVVRFALAPAGADKPSR
ncbi:MAG: hypothetical protein QF830_10405 [Rhodospirillales bacterium]|jgi:hypothetical protein|nr:hypothetical protein [Rhodospirillales bacterium]MDP6884538.1 hypothetical protein [Rhodospirillales bacterium]